MLKNRNLLCISGTEWHGNYIKPVVELMKVLSATNKILFVDNAHTYKDALAGVQNKPPVDFKMVFGLKNRLKEIKTENGGIVYMLTPPLAFPVSFLPKGVAYDMMIRYNAMLLRIAVRKALRKLDMNHDLINFTSFNPAMGVMTARDFKERVLIYHCYDEIKGANSWLRRHGERMEEQFLPMADATIVSSKGLYESKKPYTKRCFIVKNAVKAELFAKGQNSNIDTTKKVVGFVGTIDYRMDYDIVTYLIENMPDAQFIFVGRTLKEEGAELLNSYPNVTLAGPRNPEELPSYLKTFSVAIIPYVKDKLTEGIYPMKINEYLAAGLPVISANFGDMTDFKQIIKLADTKEDFLESVKAEIEGNTHEKQQARIAVANGNTWHHRGEELSAAILQTEAELYPTGK
ncbi:glycosyltransferase [Mucilaginibacter sp.]|uniref:glycosyltransferase n=1 Tax=Mucilaginibacter sp. TaxID=1882438 RepID=UPI0035BC5A6E